MSLNFSVLLNKKSNKRYISDFKTWIMRTDYFDNILAYWDFNVGSGTTLIDQTENGNNGTIYGATYSMDVPILGAVTGNGRLEGGDVLWLDEKTVAVGEGYRSNAEGIRQFRQLLGDLVDEVISIALPHWTGPNDCLHLLSLISPVDHDLVVVYSRLMPVPFRDRLLARGMKFVEVPDSEWDSMACNVLAVAPRKVIMMDGNLKTQAALEKEGVEVSVYDGSEISLKGAGGPTCLTRPLLRT